MIMGGDVSKDKLEHILESLLFIAGEPILIPKLIVLSGCKKDEVAGALASLEHTLEYRGLRLLKKDNYVSLVTAPETAEYVERLVKQDIIGELSKVALETLTIVIYKHPITRVDIDYIRGVNSSFVLRNLMVRGLVERVTAKGEARGYLYKPTIDLMKYFGISSFEHLPAYKELQVGITKGLLEQNHAD
jgi:segregation and condensation protein B